MSLLLDALRKLEEEKGLAAKRLKEGTLFNEATVDSDTAEAGEKEAGGSAVDNASAIEQSDNTSTKQGAVDMDSFTLVPLNEGDEAYTDQAHTAATEKGQTTPTDRKADTEEDGQDGHSDIDRAATTVVGSEPVETGPSRSITDQKTLQQIDVDRALGVLEDGKQGGDISDVFSDASLDDEESLPEVSVEALVQDAGLSQYQRTQVATVQTTFATGTDHQQRQAFFRWFLLGGLPILLIVAFFYVFYQFNRFTSTQQFPSPSVARDIEGRVELPAQEKSAQIGANKVPGFEGDLDQQAGVDEGYRSSAVTDQEAIITLAIPPDEEAVLSASPWIPGSAEDAVDRQGDVLSKEDQHDMVETETWDPRLIEREEAQHAIIAKADVNMDEGGEDLMHGAALAHPMEHPIDQQLLQAFQAYQDREYAIASTLYQAILESIPDNLDALLGMGAIAMWEEDWRRAYYYYAKIMSLDPNNSTAIAALLDLRGRDDPQKTISLIKALLSDGMGSAYLNFILGNIYASQSRWPEAQLSFFDAHHLDPDNPNYLFNLAVSLEHIGQYKAALKHYRLAVRQAGRYDARFDMQLVRMRIQTISENMTP